VLVLSRKPGESIVLANSIRVTVVEVSSGVVRIGIDAPREISIVRAELHREVEGENLRAVAGKESQAVPPGDLLGRLRGKGGDAPRELGKKKPKG
jgi:carbon storage regulator